MKEYMLFVAFLGCSSLAGCAPSREQIKTTATVIAAEITSTQTEEAPTVTSTPSPTTTPLPSMALTPEIQPTPMLPPVVDGWRTFVLEVFSISLPKSWIVIEQASGRADLCQHGFSVIGDQETWMLNLGVHQKKWGA